jgi:ABC-2 type transport system permease protein
MRGLTTSAIGDILVIARKEGMELSRDRRLRWLVACLLTLIFGTLTLGWQKGDAEGRERASAQHVDYQQWLEQGARNPHSAAHYGVHAFKPVNPLAFIDPGVGAFVGISVWLEAHKQNEIQFRPARDRSSLQRFGELTPALLLQTLVPLLLILVGFAGFAAERENGTLRQLLSLGITRQRLLAGKALALLGLMGAMIAPAIVAGVILSMDTGDTSPRLLALAGAYLLYLGGFVFLTLGVSALARGTRQALLVLLAFWLLNSFVLPRAMTDLARHLALAPSGAVFTQALTDARRATFGHDESHPAFVAFREKVLRDYGVSRTADLPVDFRGLALREDDHAGYRIHDEHFGRLWAIYDTQDSLRQFLGWLFPALSIQAVSAGLTGTDTRDHVHFARAAEAHRRVIQEAMSEDLIQHRRHDDPDYSADQELWARIPPFAYTPPSLAERLAWQSANLGRLALWLGGCAALALWAVRRLRP